jgi:hypothetical protein
MKYIKICLLFIPLIVILIVLNDFTGLSKYPLMPDGVQDFPSLHLVSKRDPFDIERELWHDGRLSVRDTTQPYLFENVPVEIRGRGNSSWVRGPEKRPLRLRFRQPRAMLDSGHKARDWVLVANHFDMSLVRNHAAFYLSGLLDGINWTPFSRFVHLYINDDYAGVYELNDERDIGPGRLDLNYHINPALSEYLFEMDGSVTTWIEEQGGVESVDFFAVGERAFRIRFPRRRHWKGHIEYLRDFVLNADEIIHSLDYGAIASVIDIPSLVDFYLIQEFFKEIDVGYRSVFLQLRGWGSGRKIYFGPIWDFDRSAGNTIYWTEPRHIFAGRRCSWFSAMLEIPEMVALITERWNEIKSNEIEEMIRYITYLTFHYEKAFERNFERHGHIFGGEPVWFVMLPEATTSIDTFRGQADYLLDWFYGRVEWLDDYFN